MKDKTRRKYQIFLEIAKLLNKKFNIEPVLFGSLGLNIAINDELPVDDVDMLVENHYLDDDWRQFCDAIESWGYRLINEKEHEFIKADEVIAFGKLRELDTDLGIKIDSLVRKETDGIKYRELTPEQYLQVYQTFSVDSYRRKKKGDKDLQKIAKIKHYLG